MSTFANSSPLPSLSPSTSSQSSPPSSSSSVSTIFDEKVVENLRQSGYAVVDLSNVEGNAILSQWETQFRTAFSQCTEVKMRSGEYRSDRGTGGLAVGYRRDDNREFFETRLTDDITSSVIPSLDDVPGHNETVLALCRTLGLVGYHLLSAIAKHGLLVDHRCITELTDLPVVLHNELSQEVSSTVRAGEKAALHEYQGQSRLFPPLSSSVLRICSYPNVQQSIHDDIAFGSHTDTSFLTISPCSSVPGVEVYDWSRSVWLSPEMDRSSSCVIVFVGEMLEIITKRKFRAVVHRVRSPSFKQAEGETTSRVSAPYLIRGLHKAVFSPKNYNHPGGEEAVNELADLDGVTCREIHKILDFKRQRCAKSNENNPAEWVLSSFGVTL